MTSESPDLRGWPKVPNTGDGVDHTSGAMHCTRWNQRATENVERWGHQRHDTVLLALIEEVGEIAMAFQRHTADAGLTQPPVEESPHAYRDGMRLIMDMASLGVRTRNYLEEHYPEPSGDGADGVEIELYGTPTDPVRMYEEIDDAGPLLLQLIWAIESEIGGRGFSNE